ncbi:MAG TPA: PAS domain S-box protein, partial [Syntrophorhabdaceae bacterium]|nr:PAS domain S-box protein [Syntrophorhabdaceae bacterium]
ITVLEEAITSLKKSESSYKEFVERSPDAIIIHNGERFVYANHRALKLYGVDDQKDLIGRNILDYIHPDDKEAIKAMVRDILGREIITPISEFRIISPHGKEINIQSTASCISYEGKKAVQVIIRDVTEYKKMEKALIESEARYRNIFENATEGIFQTTPEGRYLDANPAFVRMFGFSSLDELKKEVKDIGRQLYVNPEDRERFKKELADNGYVRDFEVQVKRKDGYPFWISINARVVYDEKGNIMYYEGTNSDITRRKQAEDALRASEEKYRNILERSIEGFFQATPEGRFLSANPALAHIFGYSSPEEMINEVKDLKRLYVQPEQRERLKELYESQGYVYGFEVEVYRKDSKKIWISMTARAIKDEKGKILYYEGTTEDITQRKLAEMALRASEKKFFAAFQSSPNLMAISTVKDGRYIDVNEAFCKALGYSRSEVIGKTSIHLHIFEKKEDRDRFIEKLSRGDKVRNEIANIRTKIGDVRIISFNADIIEIEGEPYLLSSGEDITERIKIEKALRESEERYRVAIESSNDGIAIIKGNYHLFVNRRFVEIFGYDSPEDIVGKPVTYLVHHEDKAMVEDINRKRQEGVKVPSRYEFRGVKKDGEIVFIEVSAAPISFYGESMTLAFLRDVSDRKRLEAQLMQAQKMEAIGQLAGGIAHDFNNILTAIIGYASLMEMRLKDGDPLKSYTQHILSSAHRAAQLTQGLLAFSRKQIINLKPVNISEIISNLRNIPSRIIGEDIDFSISIKEPTLIAMADSVQIEQVLMNLATNARDAMPKGGRLTIETARIEMDEDFIKKHQFGKIGPYALISVIDTGTGIDEDIKDRIFNPFFTTKEVGQGTGLGLSIVYGIIKQHNGYITVDSELGKGSVFNIFLPLLEMEYKKQKRDEEKRGPFHSGGGEAILLCEDDEIVRHLTKEVLMQAGYYVIEAKDGEEALEQFQRYKNMIDLLILDVVMPKKSGIEVFGEIKKIKPDANVLFMSGYPKEVMERRGVTYKGLHIVSKPVEPTNLLKMVRELIDIKTG